MVEIPPMFASELPEWELLWLMREVSRRAHVEAEFSINPDLRTGVGLFGIAPLMNLNPREVSAIDWTIEELKGILAHETGHIALGHVWNLDQPRTAEENRLREFAADDFATKIGLGPNLRHGLSAYIHWHNITGLGSALFEDTDTHPALPKRIERLPL